MLAMARILRTGARLLLLDEITEGLAPVIVKKLGEVIRLLKSRGYTIVLVEQNFRFAAPWPTATTCWSTAASSCHGPEGLSWPSKTEMLHALLGV
jgi:branched-chain amino acid transport system ATP-binding protein